MSTSTGRRRAAQKGSGEKVCTGVSRVRDQFGGDPFGVPSGTKSSGRRISPVTLDVLSKLKTKDAGWLGSLLDVSGLSYGGAEHISRPYEEDGWVHTCLKEVAAAVRQVPLRFWTTDPATDPDAKTVDDGHELVQLFAKPNPSMSAAVFREAGVLHRKLDGEDFWLLYGKDGKPWDGMHLPEFIHPVRGGAMDPNLDSSGRVESWKVSVHGGAEETFPPNAVVHFREYDPSNPLRGLGDVEVLLRDLEMGFQAQRYMEALVRNSGDPGGFIKIKGGVNRTERDALEEEAEQSFGPEKRGRWKILEGEDAEYTPNSISPKDMEFGELFEWIRDKTASVLGVPLPVIGVLENATYSNYQEAVRVFWKGGNGVINYLRTVEDGINAHLLPRIRNSQNLVARFDVSQIEALQDDKVEKIEALGKLKERFPEVSLAEAAAIVGLELDEIDVGDLRLVPAGITTLDAVLNPPEPETPDEEPEVEDEPDDEEEPPEPEEEAAVLEEREVEETAPEPSDAEVAAAEERSSYWAGVETRVYEPGEKSIASSYRDWSKSYEKAQIKRLESYAKNGEDGKGFAAFRGKGFQKGEDDLFFANSLTEQDIEILLLNKAEWADKFDGAIAADLEGVFGASVGDMAAELQSVAVDIQDPAVLDFLAQQRIQLVEGHTEVLAKRVRSSLLKTFSGNENMATLQEHVRDMLPELTKDLERVFGTREARALTIARTETAHASNGARFMQMKKSGVESTQWITSGDQRVRGAPGTAPTNHSHYELDGKEVPLGEVFSRKLKFPSDPDADAGDVINCRCITRPGKRTEEVL